MLDSVYLHAKSREQISDTLWPVLKQQVEEAIKHWREPDRGIWEVRGEPQHFTSSKIMCWVALDRGAKLAELQGGKDYAQQWRAIAEEIKADILANGVDSRGVLTQRYGDDALDASLLLAVLTRFLPADDPRVRATVLAIADELTEDGLVLRYRVEETDDGLSGEEGTFTICSFWLVSALVEIGEMAGPSSCASGCCRSPARCTSTPRRSSRAPGRHLGNFPQAFTHLALINAVVHVIRAEERVRQLRRVHAGQRADVGRRSAERDIANAATRAMDYVAGSRCPVPSGATRGAHRDEDFGHGGRPGGDHDGDRRGGRWLRQQQVIDGIVVIFGVIVGHVGGIELGGRAAQRLQRSADQSIRHPRRCLHHATAPTQPGRQARRECFVRERGR